MKTSLIIPCYFLNSKYVDMTNKCIESLDDRPDEVIIVDDGSPYPYVKRLPYKAKFITRKENGGYATAVNDGMAAATGDILVLGNNDLVFHTGWLDDLLSVLHEGFDIATCWTSDQRYILDDVIKEGGKFGSLFAMKREVYETIGGFDEQFRGYFSDLDYRRRVLDAGFRIGMNHGLVVQHEAKATYKKTDPNDDEYLRSMRLYEIKHGVVE
jgi:GT2 family glycosyltransferase